MPRLDWRSRHDPRSLDFLVRDLLEPAALRTKTWACQYKLNQGDDGACVGFGWTHEIAAKPKTHKVDTTFAFDLYHRARELDEWPGEDYEGTSVLAGAKAAQERGYLQTYRWALGIDDVLDALAQLGPVVLGIPWLDTMFDPDVDHVLNCNGNEAGGHCILARGIKIVKGSDPLVRLRNSWGEGWGYHGDAYIVASDLERLLKQAGEACIPTDS